MYKHILIPTDGSHLSTGAVEKALVFAKEIGARATILTVTEPFRVFSATIEQLELTRKEYDQHCKQMAERILADASGRARTIGTECGTRQLSSDEPASAIIETAEERGCDLIAMASHGRKGLAALLVGSVTIKVLAHSKTPVLVYR